jgi:hypothetical protein
MVIGPAWYNHDGSLAPPLSQILGGRKIPMHRVSCEYFRPHAYICDKSNAVGDSRTEKIEEKKNRCTRGKKKHPPKQQATTATAPPNIGQPTGTHMKPHRLPDDFRGSSIGYPSLRWAWPLFRSRRRVTYTARLVGEGDASPGRNVRSHSPLLISGAGTARPAYHNSTFDLNFLVCGHSKARPSGASYWELGRKT